MPNTATSYAEMNYSVMILVESSVMYQHEIVLEEKINQTEILICLGILAMLAIAFILISCVIFVFSRRIVKPIFYLTKFTQELKKASDQNEKKAIIEQVKTDPNFAYCHKEYQNF